MRLERIISGGQTGVDRGALDAALRLGVPVVGSPRPDRSLSDILWFHSMPMTIPHGPALTSRRPMEL